MKTVTFTTILCVVTSCFGLPAGPETTYDSFGLPETGNHIIDIDGYGAYWNLKFGKVPYSSKNFMTREQRAKFLPVMKALVKVMETNKPAPEDINTLLVKSRDLMKDAPKGKINGLGGFGGFLGGLGRSGGLDGIAGMGLPETGDVIKIVNGEANINTQFGMFPLSETTLMTAKERAEFLPVSKTFVKVLQMDNIDVATMNLLLKQSRELTDKIKSRDGNDSGLLGGLGGFGGFFGGFGGLGARGKSGGLNGLAAFSGGFNLNDFIQSAVKRDSSTNNNAFSKILLPKTEDQIVNVPGQGPSFNTAVGKLPLGKKNILTTEERARFLPVMKALEKVMQTDRPTASDINNLLVLSRDLKNYIPEGSNIGGFASLETFANMGIPETGDVIKIVNGEPHIVTTFGAFPLSKISLMTTEERKTYLPAVRAFIKVLEKDTLNPTEMNTLLKESRKLLDLIPDNFISQFKNGLNGLG